MHNRQLVKKSAITTADITTAGLLNPEQANKFIDYMVDQSVLLKEIEVIRMNSDKHQLDSIGVSSRIVRKGTEAAAPTETAGISTGRRELSVTEVILPFDISFSFLEDNIERANAEDHIAKLFAVQFANDVEDLGINGDSSLNSVAQPFLSIENGWLKIAKDDTSTHKFDTNASTDYKGVVFPGLLAAMPDKYKKNSKLLKFYVAPSVEEAYREQLSARQTGLGDDILESGRRARYQGIDIVPVPFLPATDFMLTQAKNLAFGIRRQIRIGKQVQERMRIIEYTITARIDYEYKNSDSLVIGYDVV